MTLAHLIGFLHVATLAIGFGGLLIRTRALKKLSSTDGLTDVFYGDNLYGIAALLWIGTGFWRAFGGLEKGTDYYLDSAAFLIKMGLFTLIFLLEIYPMVTFIKWRIATKRQQPVDITVASTLYRLCMAQLAVLLAIVYMATAMARGMWYG